MDTVGSHILLDVHKVSSQSIPARAVHEAPVGRNGQSELASPVCVGHGTDSVALLAHKSAHTTMHCT